ncbi:MAG: hypothetical protein KME23_01665 [Goleter apudmare HA4340-LM2]|nr:hypothetical protein [Goleter apudmare HA4340-LM2]
MNHFFSITTSMYYPLSQSAINSPTLIPAPLLPNQPMPIITPISPTLPLLPQNSFRLTI